MKLENFSVTNVTTIAHVQGSGKPDDSLLDHEADHVFYFDFKGGWFYSRLDSRRGWHIESFAPEDEIEAAILDGSFVPPEFGIQKLRITVA